MKLIKVTNIQRGCVYDGPGVRTTVFLKGCTLHCPWCCNPETISYTDDFFINDDKCLLAKGVPSTYCKECEKSGGNRTIRNCIFGVSEMTSQYYQIEDLYEMLIKDKLLYEETGGGVTFSGGEPLLQATQIARLLEKLHLANIHVLFETTLNVPNSYLEKVIPWCDSFIIDLKLQPQMMLNDDKSLELISNHIKKIYDKELFFRMVFVDGLLEQKDLILMRLQQLSVNRIELLSCHNLGAKKYKKMGLRYNSFVPDKRKASEFVEFLNNNQIETNLLSI